MTDHKAREALDLKSVFPHGAADAVRVVSVRLPASERYVIVELDAKHPKWTPPNIVLMTRGLRNSPELRDAPMEVVVDWLASYEGIVAVYVHDRIEAGGYTIGVKARFRPYDTADPFVALVARIRETVKGWFSEMARATSFNPQHAAPYGGNQP